MVSQHFAPFDYGPLGEQNCLVSGFKSKSLQLLRRLLYGLAGVINDRHIGPFGIATAFGGCSFAEVHPGYQSVDLVD